MPQRVSFPLQFEIDVYDMVALKSADPGIGITSNGDLLGYAQIEDDVRVKLALLVLIEGALRELGPRYGFRSAGGSTQVVAEEN